MTSIQERLQLKRVPLDKWSIREQLCLASAVACSGDQNWMSVSRSLKMMCGTNRPSDWFSQKSCAAQYGKLLENAETPKRKKRTDKDVSSTWNTVETPGESILRKLTQERMAELNRLIQEEQLEYNRIKEETVAVKATSDEAKLREMWQQITAEENQREKESAQHSQWLKEREERKLELERAWRPATHLYQTSAPNSPAQSPRTVSKSTSDDMDIEEIKTGTSPLLSSLLKSPSTSSSNNQTASLVTPAVTSTRAAAPTITNLLTGTKPTISVEIPHNKESFPLMHHSLTGPPREHSQASHQLPVQSPSQAAPTLSMLLENKSTKESASPKNPLRQQQQPNPEILLEESANKSSIGSPLKDEEQQLMEVFNTLIPDNIDVLADILDDNDAIILSPELLAEAEDSILESVESLMADQAGLGMDTDDFHHHSISNPVAIVAESMSTAELVEQLTSTSGFPIGPTSTAKGDANPSPPPTMVVVDDQVINLDSPDDQPLSASLGTTKSAEAVAAIKEDDDDQSDLSNDAPLSELLKDTSNVVEKGDDNNHDENDDDEDASPKEPTDVFESDSNDDKCLEIIKREIHELTGLKENESSDNSNEAIAKLNEGDVVSIKDEEDDDDSKMITVIPVKEESMDGEENPDGKEAEKTETEEKADNEELEIHAVIDGIKSDPSADDEIAQEKSRKLSTHSSDRETPFEDALEDLPNESSAAAKVVEESITIEDTDDESVIEMITDDKNQRAKRDYTRRKVDVEKRTEDNNAVSTLPDDPSAKSTLSTRMRLKERDRSESPYVDDTDADSTHSRSKRRYSSTPVLDSMPNSPASYSDDNREYRAWKKSIQLVLNRLSMHKYTNYFLRPINDEQSYREIILRPMDLQTLKRNVDSGLVRTTQEFQRDVMLMCSNAAMFNATDDLVQQSMIRQMETDALQTIDTIMEAWRKEFEKPSAQSYAASMPVVGVASIASPVATAAQTSTPTAVTTKQLVRGRKSHRVSASNQQ